MGRVNGMNGTGVIQQIPCRYRLWDGWDGFFPIGFLRRTKKTCKVVKREGNKRGYWYIEHGSAENPSHPSPARLVS
jgi:hypothetical protein